MASSNHTAYTSQIVGLPASADACYKLSTTWDSLTVARYVVAESVKYREKVMVDLNLTRFQIE